MLEADRKEQEVLQLRQKAKKYNKRPGDINHIKPALSVTCNFPGLYSTGQPNQRLCSCGSIFNYFNYDILSVLLVKMSFMLKNHKTAITQTEPGIAKWLGGKSKIKKAIRSDFDIVSLSNEGITKASAESLAEHLGISRKAFAEEILDMSVKTLERKRATDKLDKRISSHILEIARVVDHAFTVFEESDKVKRWLHKENRALNNVKPIKLFDTLTGLNMVNDVLGRIEEGVYS